MRVVIVGAGPTGLMLGATLAQRGHRVTAVDQDAGPGAGAAWRRRGVMQFEHPHGFRPQVPGLLQTEWPDAWRSWRALGAEPIDLPPLDGVPQFVVRSRRSTFERALRSAATAVDGLTLVTGRVDGLADERGRVTGVVTGGDIVRADLVIDASGRLSRFAPPAAVSAETGMAYVTRTYRRRPEVPAGPMTSPVAWYGAQRGYDAYVFPHDDHHISVVLIRPTADAALGVLRTAPVFEAAVSAISGLSEWVNPALATPTSGVLVGGRLLNAYRRAGRRPGLVSIGDAVTTTAPTAGRGIAMACMQIAALVDLLDRGADPSTIAEPFGAWCDQWMRPWVDDHIANDAESVRRWRGDDIDLDVSLTSAAIVDAARADPRIAEHVRSYLAMAALPASLAAAEALALSVYRSGWRPAINDGPTRDELVRLAGPARARHVRTAA